MTDPAPRDASVPWGKWLVGVFVVAVVAVIFAFRLDRYLDWDFLRSNADRLKERVDDNYLVSILLFTLIYVAATSLSLPSSTGLSLLGGALFGRWVGLGVVSVAATIGATVACLASRYLFRDWVERKYGHRLTGIHRGIERDGGYYLLTMRLVPVFPYFLLNLAMGLTRMRIRTYALVTWVGMLPVTLIVVNAGDTIADIRNPSDILSWDLMLSLAAVGIVPALLRMIVNRLRKKQANPAEVQEPGSAG